jgi:four helix bundle protein
VARNDATSTTEHFDLRNRCERVRQTITENSQQRRGVRQLVRASGSVAANWIEADEALSKNDFLMRVKICRKEAKESRLFLRLIDTGLAKDNIRDRDALSAEARELVLIFSAIISKSE